MAKRLMLVGNIEAECDDILKKGCWLEGKVGSKCVRQHVVLLAIESYQALSHDIEMLSPFLQPAEMNKDPLWTPDQASFIIRNVQALLRDWMYLCIICLDSEDKMAIAWLD
jgi:hypothetical protein